MSIQSLYDIGETIRNARVFNLKEAAGKYAMGDNLFQMVERLFDLLLTDNSLFDRVKSG